MRVDSLQAADDATRQFIALNEDSPVSDSTLTTRAPPSWQVLENAEGGVAGSLLAALDFCATPMGRRRLRAWLCRPLGRISDITDRQDAVEELMSESLADALDAARPALVGATRLTPNPKTLRKP